MDEVLKEGLLKLIEVVETAAPQLWAIGVRQATIQGIGFLMALLSLAVLTAYLLYRGAKLLQEYKITEYQHYSDKEVVFVLFAGGISGLVVTLMLAYSTIGRFLNPQYYAIKVLMDLVK